MLLSEICCIFHDLPNRENVHRERESNNYERINYDTE